jgi:hypothetical protein
MLTTDLPQTSFAAIIPDPESIRQRLKRCQAETDLLRRLLRLSLCRDEVARSLVHLPGPEVPCSRKRGPQ